MISVGELGEPGGEISETLLSRRLRAGVGDRAGRGVRGVPGVRDRVGVRSVGVLCLCWVGVLDMGGGDGWQKQNERVRHVSWSWPWALRMALASNKRPVRGTTTVTSGSYSTILLHMFCYADQLGSSGKQPGNQLTTTSTASSAPAWPRVPGFAYPSSASRVETLDVPSVRLPSRESTSPSN